MSYDEAVKRIEAIVRELEQAEALSLEDYRKKAAEAKQLLDLCEESLKKMSGDLLV
ncbi:MAG: exodeoxyribonuclease VII small subunit [Paludibacteraceae bacterium]|nr:exodeoxyribonuclease VII small subunit [Paludibacteraceae bacterium]